MTTYSIKVQNTMRSTNPRYNTDGGSYRNEIRWGC